MVIKKHNDNTDPSVWPLYLFANSPKTQEEKYQKRLERFFDFLSMKVATQTKKGCFIKIVETKEINGLLMPY